MVERRPSKRHQLAPDAVVTWLALAVLSGVAGNLSYDLLKAAPGKITKRRKKLEVVAHGSADVNSGRIVIGPEAQLTVNWSDEEARSMRAAPSRVLQGATGRAKGGSQGVGRFRRAGIAAS